MAEEGSQKFDKLHDKRKKLGKNIDSLVKQLAKNNDGYVVAVNGSWGYGKSYFIEALEDAMENSYNKNRIKIDSGQKFLHFDAWKNDYTNDPLMSFVSEMCLKFKNKSLKNKAVEIISAMSKRGAVSFAKILIAIATEKFAKKETLKKFIDDLGVDSIDEIASKELSKHDTIKKAIDGFKKELRNFAEKKCKGTLIVFIDELDRCRPNYTIELLENIKHIFNTKGVIFILAINQAELCKSIRKVYGDINAEHYLKRFINYTIQLPKPDYEEYVETIFIEFDDNLKEIFKEEECEKEFKGIFADLSKLFDLDLRGQNECMREIELILLTQENDNDRKNLIFLISMVTFYVMCKYINKKVLGREGSSGVIECDLYNTVIKKEYIPSPGLGADLITTCLNNVNDGNFRNVMKKNEKFELLLRNKKYKILENEKEINGDLNYLENLLKNPSNKTKSSSGEDIIRLDKVSAPGYLTHVYSKSPLSLETLICDNHGFLGTDNAFYRKSKVEENIKLIEKILRIKKEKTIDDYVIPRIEMYEFPNYCEDIKEKN
jgi:hypothetical protein